MEERVFATALGEIHYWVNPGRGRPMVFLPVERKYGNIFVFYFFVL